MTGQCLDFLVPGPLNQRTGGYIYDAALIAALRRRHWQVVVHELPGSHPFPDAAARADAARRLATLAEGAWVVIDGLALPAVADALPAAAARLRLIGLIHHPLSLETGLTPCQAAELAELERAHLPRFARIIVTSRFTGADLPRHAPLSTVPVVIEPASPRPCRLPRARHPRPTRRPLRLLCVATLTPRKGHLLLIRALARLRHRPWRLDCAGASDRAPATTRTLRAGLRGLGLAGRVRLRGSLSAPALARAYRGADLFVLPSFHEGYGMAAAEAMAHGLPCLVTRAGALGETVPAAAGQRVPVGDVTALRRALRFWLNQPARVRRVGAIARRLAARRPDWDFQAARFCAILAT